MAFSTRLRAFLRERSLLGYALLSFPICVLVATLAVSVYAGIRLDNAAREQAVVDARDFVQTMRIIRGYYNKSVVAKVRANGAMQADYLHETDPGKIPIPATFVHDVSALLKDQNTSITMSSPFPWPGRGKPLDDFRRKAWDAFESDPKAVIAAEEVRNGQRVMRVAVADVLSDQACVSCHNEHPQSPRRNWKLGDVRGILEVVKPIEAQIVSNRSLAWSIGLALLGAATVACVIAFFAVDRVVRPLSRIREAMHRLAQGETDVEIIGRGRHDDIGAMAEAVAFFQDQARGRAALEAQTAAGLAERTRRSEFIAAETAAFDRELQALLSRVTVGIAELNEAARRMAGEARQIRTETDGLSTLSKGALDGARQVDVAASTLRDSLSTIARQVDHAGQISKGAASSAARVDVEMEQLSKAADRIRTAMAMIKGVAEQTNLLALNATIEAARAGEAGRGFAVVAGEVKALANQTARATDEVAACVDDIQVATRGALGAIGDVGKVIGDIVSTSGEIARSMSAQESEIGKIQIETSRSTSTSAGVNDSAQRVAGANAVSEDLARAVSGSAETLSGEIDALMRRIAAFTGSVKAA